MWILQLANFCSSTKIGRQANFKSAIKTEAVIFWRRALHQGLLTFKSPIFHYLTNLSNHHLEYPQSHFTRLRAKRAIFDQKLPKINAIWFFQLKISIFENWIFALNIKRILDVILCHLILARKFSFLCKKMARKFKYFEISMNQKLFFKKSAKFKLYLMKNATKNSEIFFWKKKKNWKVTHKKSKNLKYSKHEIFFGRFINTMKEKYFIWGY